MRSRHPAVSVLSVVAVIGLTACTSIRAPEATESTAPAVPVASVAEPEERMSPFCLAMSELTVRLDDPSVDATTTIIEEYTEMRDVVPEEILGDFDAVLAQLKGDEDAAGATAVTDQPAAAQGGSDEGYAVDNTPVGRVNAYVDAVCRGTNNNPGPPATPPK